MKCKSEVAFVTKHEKKAANTSDPSSTQTLLLALHFCSFRQSEDPMTPTWEGTEWVSMPSWM